MFDLDRSVAIQMAEQMFGWTDFDEFVKMACNEANYWAGYKSLFVRIISDEMDLDEGLDLTKKADSNKQRLYKLRKERKDLIEQRTAAIIESKGVYTQEQQKTYEKELKRLEDAFVIKAFDVYRQRKPFVEFIEYLNPDMELRTRYKPQAKKIDEDEE
jgi:predicted nuclease with TOPRIM domain